MADKFDYFVIFAEMRTGSNFLEANINEFSGLKCHGEAFNPHFIGFPNKPDLFGFTQSMRESDPTRLIDVIRENTDGLGGFRFFHDHDPRILDHVLSDPRCAKIILTRNPVESFVSWKIAAQTGQWKLTDMKHHKSAKITFDPNEFEAHLAQLQAFQVHLLQGLQTTGQTGFYIAYEDLQDVNVLNGLARYLGVDEKLSNVSDKLKKQNPEALTEKVTNFDEMETSLSRIDLFDLSRTPNFEPRRNAVVPSYVAAVESPLLFLPIRSGPEERVKAWMAAIDGVEVDALTTDFSQKSLRQWKRKNVGHRSFTVLRHPAARAYASFCDHILNTGPGSFTEIRNTLRKVYKLPIPAGAIDATFDRSAHRAAFLEFLKFLKGNLSGQTSIRVDASWASQLNILQGMSQFALPDVVLREDALEAGLERLSTDVGRAPVALPVDTEVRQVALQEFYDKDVEAAVRDVYQRDYMGFGFGAWK